MAAVVRELDEEQLRADLRTLHDKGEVEALTICFINAYINGEHERRARDIAAEIFTDTPISISSDVVPEMQEYERTETTVVNSYVRPEVAKYVRNLQAALDDKMGAIPSCPFCAPMVAWPRPAARPSRRSTC